MRSFAPLVLALLLLAPTAPAADPVIATELVATGLTLPTHVAFAPGDPTRLFVLQRNGVIRLVKDGVLLATPFLDLTGIIPAEFFNGLLGIAFHPDYETNGCFYLHHARGVGTSDRLTVARYNVSTDPDVADPGSREEILVLGYPGLPGHHLGGWLGFGPDGYLYVPLGDGQTTGFETAGGARAQDLASPWGKTLRLDVDADDYPLDPDRDFAIPLDNPFVGQGGEEAVWLLGLRQPYRAAFDRVTGDFWIADVGWHDREEIDFVPSGSPGGQNFGWNCAEGTLCATNGNCNCLTSPLVDPIHEYDHADGCSIIGGAVYRGSAIPSLAGRFFFADWCSNRIWSVRRENGVAVDLIEHTAELAPLSGAFSNIVSISEGHGGELYIVDAAGVHRVVGEPWLDLGGGTVGSGGSPTLCAHGTLVAGTPYSLDLVNLPPGALLVYWLAFAPTPVNFFGGTIHTLPHNVQLIRVANGAGGYVQVPFPWPAGIPAGIEMTMQFLVQDPSVIYGITLSNAVRATTP